ncbi:MAG: glycosyltransferase family 2 protein [Nitrospinae bacterium]|nr:glycosyltransferase family 2 protein [Nitrospinota bacterium]
MLSVVIVNYNSGDYLKKCLDSVAEKFAAIEYEVVVVDNASTDDSIALARKAPKTLFIMGETNRGFAAGCNAGASVATGDYLLFLNPDTRILSDNIHELIERFKHNPNAGALGCQNRLPDGSIQTSAYGFPTLFLVFAWAFRLREVLKLPGLKTLLSPFLKNRFGQFNPHDRPRAVDYVTGAFLLVKREHWRRTGEFDQRFFLFCEEIDWCKRLKETGAQTVFDPSFEIEHYVGFSSQKEKPRVLLEKYKSYAGYFEKHHSGFRLSCLKMVFWTSIRYWMLICWLKGDREYYIAYKGIQRELFPGY